MQDNKRKRAEKEKEKGKEKETDEEREVREIDAAMMSMGDDFFVPATPEASEAVPSEEPPIKKKKGSGYRLNSSQLFLTYPQCDLEPVVILDLLKIILKRTPIMKYLISKELHQVKKKFLVLGMSVMISWI